MARLLQWLATVLAFRSRRPALREHDDQGRSDRALPGGEPLEEIQLGEHATNCIFDGSTLYVTATRVAEVEALQRTGTFWRVETNAVGLDLIPGRL